MNTICKIPLQVIFQSGVIVIGQQCVPDNLGPQQFEPGCFFRSAIKMFLQQDRFVFIGRLAIKSQPLEPTSPLIFHPCFPALLTRMSIFPKLSVDHMFGEHFMPRASWTAPNTSLPYWEIESPKWLRANAQKMLVQRLAK
jgi:hypothetical protein